MALGRSPAFSSGQVFNTRQFVATAIDRIVARIQRITKKSIKFFILSKYITINREGG